MQRVVADDWCLAVFEIVVSMSEVENFQLLQGFELSLVGILTGFERKAELLD